MSVYDKPLIYYSLTTLMMAGLREILIITTPEEIDQFKRLLGDGRQWGIELSFAIQDHPGGIAEAFLIGRDFLAGGSSSLILGDNIFYGDNLRALLRGSAQQSHGATVFALPVAASGKRSSSSRNIVSCAGSVAGAPVATSGAWKTQMSSESRPFFFIDQARQQVVRLQGNRSAPGG